MTERVAHVAGLLGGLVLLSWSAAASAESPTAAAVWYRSGEGCPEGAEFVAMLQRRAIVAELAEAGDRIDFVVTLGPTPEGPRGRLERQTDQGSVALRVVQGASCESVADALALTLALTWVPAEQQTEGAKAPPPVVTPAPTRAMTAPQPASPAPDRHQASPAPNRARAVRLGAGPMLWMLSEHTPFMGGAIFAELRSTLAKTGYHPALRLSAALLHSPDAGAAIRGWVGGARAEGCPVMVGNALLQVHPCTGFDLGMMRAVSSEPAGTSASGFWAAWASHARLSWQVAKSFGLEAQAGVVVPLTQYELTVGRPERTVSETRSWGFAGGIAAYGALP